MNLHDKVFLKMLRKHAPTVLAEIGRVRSEQSLSDLLTAARLRVEELEGFGVTRTMYLTLCRGSLVARKEVLDAFARAVNQPPGVVAAAAAVSRAEWREIKAAKRRKVSAEFGVQNSE